MNLGWRGMFVFELADGPVEFHNEVQDYGRLLTYRLWTGSEPLRRFASIRLSLGGQSATEAANFTIAQSEEYTEGSAVFHSIGFAPDSASLLDDAGTVIATAPISGVPADESFIVRRRDYLILNPELA